MLAEIPLQLVDADHAQNDRFAYDPQALRELADSIAHVGLINPVRVSPNGDRYTLRSGYRRCEACRLLGRPTITALVVREPISHHVQERLAENLIRADLTPVEEAYAVQRLRQAGGQSDEDLATALNRSPNWIRHRLTLTNYPEAILEALHVKDITIAVADELALVRDPLQQAALLSAAIQNGCTARTAALWRSHANAQLTDPTAAPTQAPGPPVAGPPPTVQKQCFACQRPCDITTMSYVTLCPQCVPALEEALAGPPRTTASTHPTGT